jgi:hypothetical protein
MHPAVQRFARSCAGGLASPGAVLTVAFFAVLASGAQRPEGQVPQEPGVIGTVAPQPGEIVLDATLLHEDRVGRAQHVLAELAGASGAGFAGIWRDTRDGNAGLYFGRLDALGHSLEKERPAYATGSAGREVEPSIALGPDGGALAWYSSGSATGQQVKLRVFDREGVLQGGDVQLGSPGDKHGQGRARAFAEGAADDRRAAPGFRVPSVAVHRSAPEPEGAARLGAVVWAEEGLLWLQRFRANAELLGDPIPINAHGTAAVGGPRLAAAESGELACAWRSADGIRVAIEDRSARAGAPVSASSRLVGAGNPIELCADPSGDGWWLLAQDEQGFTLRHLGPDGAPNAPERRIPAGPRDTAALAPCSRGVALLAQHQDSMLELLVLGPEGGELARAEAASGDKRSVSIPSARVASAGDALLVAWTEQRTGESDVYYRLFDAQARGGETHRWNTDEASAEQLHPDIDGRGGDRAVAAWVDGRSGVQRAMVRVVSAKGPFLTGEVAVPAPLDPASDAAAGEGADSDSAIRPAVALHEQGPFLVTWKAQVGRSLQLWGQGFDAQAKPLSKAVPIDDGRDCQPQWSADCVALDLRKGYAVAFDRRGEGLFVRRLELSGKPSGDARLVSKDPRAANPSLALLDDGRLIVAWDITVAAGNRAVRARFLTAQVEPQGSELEFELMQRGDDWDPSVAAGPRNGFAMAWCDGQDHGRDIFARFFDAKGQPASEPMAISTALNEQDFPSLVRLKEGGWAVAWEDDISYYDHTYVRRLLPELGQLGPVRTLNPREAVFNENRGAPRLAPVSTGLAAVWSDCSRSKGFDACLRILGNGFDREPARKK